MSQYRSEHHEHPEHPPITPDEHPLEPTSAAPSDGVPLGRIILGRGWPYRIG
ncbi:hypothetical protein GV794_20040 [Nocardia cyriacigeorgica]|uniref:Uncharacterized protein n=1 Tax=Nocardia cyriacigeorgica TaxID=135487 RepID=A0A6P1DD72_9NOCA|nr:hypothetical protein [Nocardia cyriacigeorgica]NEW39146.1 hypothetical protein [Nocardia cyriacigeorgica]NEW47104.1 hypothetical protein [Nocardia cyriacigeorgica]NEW53473.1 hypothetical protein [Nocardia cyriacigeorgica]NEW57928.1 hypothetical protein [Nocardia cyriacigeorgica]